MAKNLYDAVVDACKDKGMSIYAVEKAAGVANGTIRAWKDSAALPRIDTVLRVSNVIGVPVGQLMGVADE